MSWFRVWVVYIWASVDLFVFSGEKAINGLAGENIYVYGTKGCWKGEVNNWVHHRKDSKSRKISQYSIKKEDILYWLLNFLSKVDIYSKNTTNS